MLLDGCIIILIILLGFNLQLFFGKHLDKGDLKTLRILWIYHLAICVLFYFYVLANGGDAITYWQEVKINSDLEFSDYWTLGVGTNFMFALNYFPSKVLDLSFITGSILYGFLGYIGFIYLYLIFKSRIAYNSILFKFKLFPALLFLPNLHFWTSGIGKDSILFFCISLFFYAMQAPKKHILKIILALVFAYLARPHIAAFLLMAFGVGFILDGNLKMYAKVFFSLLIVSAFVYLYDTVMLYLRIEDFSIDSISAYSDDKVSKLSRGHTGSGVDISSYPFPLKVFTFLYRPLFFDITGALAIVASVENLILLVLSGRFLLLNPIKTFIKGDYFVKSLMLFFVLGSITFPLILGNLGIMLRQKNMFIPALLFLCLWSFSYKTENELHKTQNQSAVESL